MTLVNQPGNGGGTDPSKLGGTGDAPVPAGDAPDGMGENAGKAAASALFHHAPFYPATGED